MVWVVPSLGAGCVIASLLVALEARAQRHDRQQPPSQEPATKSASAGAGGYSTAATTGCRNVPVDPPCWSQPSVPTRTTTMLPFQLYPRAQRQRGTSRTRNRKACLDGLPGLPGCTNCGSPW